MNPAPNPSSFQATPRRKPVAVSPPSPPVVTQFEDRAWRVTASQFERTGIRYIVRAGTHGWTCNCPATVEYCRHVKAVRAELAMYSIEEGDLPDFDVPFTPREEIVPMVVDASDEFDPFGDPAAVTVSAPAETSVVWSDRHLPIVDLSLLPLTERLAALSAFHGLDWRAS